MNPKNLDSKLNEIKFSRKSNKKSQNINLPENDEF